VEDTLLTLTSVEIGIRIGPQKNGNVKEPKQVPKNKKAPLSSSNSKMTAKDAVGMKRNHEEVEQKTGL